MAKVSKNYKGRSPNVLRFIASCGSAVDLTGLVSSNLAAGVQLAAKKNLKRSMKKRQERMNFVYDFRKVCYTKWRWCRSFWGESKAVHVDHHTDILM